MNLLNFDEVMLVPCGTRADKPGVSPSEHRLKMVQLAVKDFFSSDFPVSVNDVEVRNGPMIMTYGLINQLQSEADASDQQGPSETKTQYYFVLGSDLVPGLHTWKEGKSLIENTACVVIHRRGVGSLSDQELLDHANYPKKEPIHINVEDSIIGIVSSSEVRRRISAIPYCNRTDLGINGLVTPGVLGYIK